MKIRQTIFYSVIILLIVLVACKQKSAVKETAQLMPDYTEAQNFYIDNLKQCIILLDSLAKMQVDESSTKLVFKEARIAFKKAETFAAYLNPDVGHRVNGPALPIYKEDTGKIIEPIGFQKLEESIYEAGVSNAQFLKEVTMIKGLLINLLKNMEKRELTTQRFFVATHQQLLRIISLGVSGFDTPVSHLGISESIIALESLEEVYTKSIRFIIQEKNAELDKTFSDNIFKAIDFVNQNMDFDTFDRYTFIRDYMNPITSNWVEIRKESGLWEGVDNLPFNFDAPTFFENNSFNVAYFTPSVNLNPTEKQIELGEKLFYDPNLSENGQMACATCHNPEKAYADGMKANLDNSGNSLKRNTPTLINSVFQKGFFWDGRSETLLDQISSVFTNDKEFNVSVHQFSKAILNDKTYVRLFNEAYGGVSTKNTDVIRALSSYISTLNTFNSKFDRNIRAEEATYTEEEQLGFNLFMGKALCATCHFIPLTNGTVPPFFSETEKEVIGVPETAMNLKVDDDLGFYWKFEEDLHKGMFKTPTVRNSAVTAPYMHNGVYASLEEVMDFYNKGGGGGMGFDLEYQTLPFDQLSLSESEQKSIIAFLQTMTDDNIK